MELKPEEFLQAIGCRREEFWEKMNAERKSYGAERPLSPAIVLRRLQFGVVMERKAAEVTAPWVGQNSRSGSATADVRVCGQ